CLDRAEFRWHGPRSRPLAQARAHDGRRRDGDERAGQRFGVHRAPAGGINAMNLPRRRFLHVAAGAAALPAMSQVAPAQPYPARPVRVIVGFTAGSATDITARLFAQKLNEAWKTPVTVENIPGAGGSVGAERVAKSAPDGSTLYWGANGAMTINP